MAETVETDNATNISINLIENNLLELRCLIKTTGICHSARCEIGRGGYLLAFTTKHKSIGFLYQSDINGTPIIKRIPWFHESHRAITAFCFDPTGSWLLTASVDGTLFIVPSLILMDDRHVTNDKWSINDITRIILVDQEFSYSR